LAEIEYTPYQKLILHEVIRMQAGEFFPMVASMAEAQKAGATAGVLWIDGIAFTFGEFPDTPEIVSEKLKGRLHKAIVWFTETSFQPEKRIQVNGRDTVVRLARADGNRDFVNLVEFLKTFRPQTAAPERARGPEDGPSAIR